MTYGEIITPTYTVVSEAPTSPAPSSTGSEQNYITSSEPSTTAKDNKDGGFVSPEIGISTVVDHNGNQTATMITISDNTNTTITPGTTPDHGIGTSSTVVDHNGSQAATMITISDNTTITPGTTPDHGIGTSSTAGMEPTSDTSTTNIKDTSTENKTVNLIDPTSNGSSTNITVPTGASPTNSIGPKTDSKTTTGIHFPCLYGKKDISIIDTSEEINTDICDTIETGTSVLKVQFRSLSSADATIGAVIQKVCSLLYNALRSSDLMLTYIPAGISRNCMSPLGGAASPYSS
ncbi:mucin-2-like [Hyla sarda]|uniref:mucin-2-like n=1 Tax=Hyla sarda TaxID=327740 RepID=UPI0024C3D4EB|nr:mucin-2-like [Hyla sarda]